LFCKLLKGKATILCNYVGYALVALFYPFMQENTSKDQEIIKDTKKSKG